jgi:CHASE3 domain sensor protein
MSNSNQTHSAKASGSSADHDKLTEQIRDTASQQAEQIRDIASHQAERLRDTARHVARQASSARDQLNQQIVEPAGEVKDAVAADSRSRLVLAVASAALAVLAGILILRRRSGR